MSPDPMTTPGRSASCSELRPASYRSSLAVRPARARRQPSRSSCPHRDLSRQQDVRGAELVYRNVALFGDGRPECLAAGWRNRAGPVAAPFGESTAWAWGGAYGVLGLRAYAARLRTVPMAVYPECSAKPIWPN